MRTKYLYKTAQEATGPAGGSRPRCRTGKGWAGVWAFHAPRWDGWFAVLEKIKLDLSFHVSTKSESRWIKSLHGEKKSKS